MANSYVSLDHVVRMTEKSGTQLVWLLPATTISS